MTANTTHWICTGIPPRIPPCGAGGEYEHTAASGSSGPAHKHTADTGHGTIAAAGDWVGRTAA
jgi:hypothetical protein